MIYELIIDTLLKIFNDGAYINNAVSNAILENDLKDHDKKVFTKIVYGVVENKILLDYYLQVYTKGKRVKPYLRNVLRVGAYVITFMDIKNHFIVKELVEIMKKKDYNSSKFVNAVLRNYERNELRSFASLSKLERLSIEYSIPLELVEFLSHDYDNLEEVIVSLLNQSNLNSYRINHLKIEDDLEVIKSLDKLNINFEQKDDFIFTKESLIGTNLFKEGKVIPEDYSSSMPPRVLNPLPNEHVLDMCSAPGSKTIQMADLMKNKGYILALDIYEHKIKLINDNAKKFGASIIDTKLADASNVVLDKTFDKILADCPCSGLGVIGHKPDLKYRMTVEKIKEIADLSYKILDNAARYLKKGGTLVYSTCTITKIENENNIKKFIKNHPDFKVVESFKTIGNYEMHQDGFYICKLEKLGD